MRYFSKVFAIFCLSVMVLAVAACGKVSNPMPIEGSGYPHSYPQH